MKFKLDENLPVSSARALTGCGHDVDTVVVEGLTGAGDQQVVAAAAAEARVLVTLDRGMGDIRTYPPGTHAGIVVLRLNDQSAPAVNEAITGLANWAAGFAGHVAGPDRSEDRGGLACAELAAQTARRELGQQPVQPADGLGPGRDQLIAPVAQQPQRDQRVIRGHRVHALCLQGRQPNRHSVVAVGLAAVPLGEPVLGAFRAVYAPAARQWLLAKCERGSDHRYRAPAAVSRRRSAEPNTVPVNRSTPAMTTDPKAPSGKGDATTPNRD